MHDLSQTPFTTILCLLTSIAALACGPEQLSAETSEGTLTDTDGETDADGQTDTDGETGTDDPPVCGNGVVELDEDCDDGNANDDDACSSACEANPCGIEWQAYDHAMVTERMSTWAPTVLDDDELVITHQIFPDGFLDTRIARFASVDGSPIESFEGSLSSSDDFPQQLLLAPNGDMILASTDYFVTRSVDVTRLGPDGAIRWARSLPDHIFAAGLRFGPTGELVLVATAELGPDDHDVMRVTLDPDDGAVLGTLGIGVADMLMGMSSEIGTGLVVDAQGRAFVSWFSQTLDQLSVSALDGDAVSWQVTLEIPAGAFGEGMEAADDGTLLVLSTNWTQSRGWVTALDPETGDELWQVSEVDLGLAGSYPLFHALAVSPAGVRVVGSQSYPFEGQWYEQAMVVGIGPDGVPLCHNTISDLDPNTEDPQVSLRFTEVISDPDGGFFAIGHRYDSSSPPLVPVDLLRARLR